MLTIIYIIITTNNICAFEKIYHLIVSYICSRSTIVGHKISFTKLFVPVEVPPEQSQYHKVFFLFVIFLETLPIAKFDNGWIFVLSKLMAGLQIPLNNADCDFSECLTNFVLKTASPSEEVIPITSKHSRREYWGFS